MRAEIHLAKAATFLWLASESFRNAGDAGQAQEIADLVQAKLKAAIETGHLPRGVDPVIDAAATSLNLDWP